MEDYLIRIIAKEARVRAMACVTTDLVHEGIRRSGAEGTAAAALAMMLTSSALMGGLVKVGQRIALKIEGSPPFNKIIAESDHNGNIRGYIGDVTPLPELEVLKNMAELFGPAGTITVVKDMKKNRLHHSAVPVQPGSLAVNLTHYLTHSEQIPSWVELGVMVDEAGVVTAAGGFLVQAMPGYSDGPIEAIRDQFQELPPIGNLIAEGKTPEEILDLGFGTIEHMLLLQKSLAFQCGCSEERVVRALISLGTAEIESLLMEEHEAVIDCQFCRKRYVVSRAELEALLRTLRIDSEDDEDGA